MRKLLMILAILVPHAYANGNDFKFQINDEVEVRVPRAEYWDKDNDQLLFFKCGNIGKIIDYEIEPAGHWYKVAFTKCSTKIITLSLPEQYITKIKGTTLSGSLEAVSLKFKYNDKVAIQPSLFNDNSKAQFYSCQNRFTIVSYRAVATKHGLFIFYKVSNDTCEGMYLIFDNVSEKSLILSPESHK